MKVLHAILIARYPERAGKWVVMKATDPAADIVMFFRQNHPRAVVIVCFYIGTCMKQVRKIATSEDFKGRVAKFEANYAWRVEFLCEIIV